MISIVSRVFQSSQASGSVSFLHGLIHLGGLQSVGESSAIAPRDRHGPAAVFGALGAGPRRRATSSIVTSCHVATSACTQRCSALHLADRLPDHVRTSSKSERGTDVRKTCREKSITKMIPLLCERPVGSRG